MIQSSPNVPYSIFVKINDTIIKKQKHLIKTSVQDLHNDLILSIPQGGFYGVRYEDLKYVLDKHLLGSRLKDIQTNEQRRRITWGCQTCIIDMLLQLN